MMVLVCLYMLLCDCVRVLLFIVLPVYTG